MFKSLRVPERLFAITMWLVSFVFAWFLSGLGGKIVGDLPGVDQRTTVESFVDSTRVRRIDQTRDSLQRLHADREADATSARLRLTTASNAYSARRESFDNWIRTRRATTDPRQDPEVLARSRELDVLGRGQRAAQQEVERADALVLSITQSIDRVSRERSDLYAVAQKQYEKVRFGEELRVFLIRLAITLPLLLLAWWLIARKRRTQYCPLYRGFVLFAVFTFFVELVPYLPSYGGYVRYGVGVLLTAVAGVYLTRAMKRYLEKRAEVERQTDAERRRALSYEAAINRVTEGVCPGCERPIATNTGATPVNFCVHCGMTLFDECPSCKSRKNAFFQYCPSCGVPAGDARAAV